MMKPTVMLILPAAKHLRVESNSKSVPRRNMLRFSVLPLTMVAALTQKEFDVVICDENVEAVDFDTEAAIVGISFMTALAPRAYELAAEFRRRGKIVAAGGYHPTLCQEEAAAHFDAVLVGDAEEIWPEFLADAERGTVKQFYRHDRPCSLEHTPSPRRDLTYRNRRQYVTVNAVQTGRGCAHGCKYCSITAFHRQTYRHRPLAQVMAELREIPRDFIFVDDNIIADRDFAVSLFDAMIPLRKRWVSQCSLKLADDPELLELARRAGCRGLFIGIETLSARNLNVMNKDFNHSETYLKRIGAIRRRGIGVIAGIIVGMDDDNVNTFEEMLKFLDKAQVDAIQVNIMTPLPGTPLFDEFTAAGRIVSTDWNDYDFRHVVIRPARMSRGELQDGADWLYHQFYRLDRILGRFCRSLFTLGPMPALLGMKLGLTYRYDNRREKIIGRNPAQADKSTATRQAPVIRHAE